MAFASFYTFTIHNNLKSIIIWYRKIFLIGVSQMYDVIIIGGGVAGLSSAVFTAKAGLETLVLDKGQSQITRVSSIQNLPGFPEGISGLLWIDQAKKQVEKFSGRIQEELVSEVNKKEDGFFEVKTEENSYQAKYVVIATNMNKQLLASFGLEPVTNAFVPNGKAKAIPNIPWTGETEIENLYLSGIIRELPSQVSVSLGQGAAVGIAVVSKEKGTPYMWHDL